MESPRKKPKVRKDMSKGHSGETEEVTASAHSPRKNATRAAVFGLLIASIGLIFSLEGPQTTSSAHKNPTQRRQKTSKPVNESVIYRFNQLGSHLEKDPTKAAELFSVITKHLKVNEEVPISQEHFLALGRDLLKNQTFHNILNKHRKNRKDKMPVNLENISIFLNPTLLRMSPPHIIYIDTMKGTIGLFAVSGNTQQKQR
jgi:hypothetical protein